MRILDVLGMGFRNLMRRKTRTLLTIVGVVVGATAIIIMLSLGIAMDEQLERTIAGMGDLTIIEVHAWAWIPNPDSDFGGEAAQNHLDRALLDRIRTWEGVSAATPFLWGGQVEVHAGRSMTHQWPNVTGIDSSFIPYLGLVLDRGEMPQPGDDGFVLFGRRSLYGFRNTRRDWRPSDQLVERGQWDPEFDFDAIPPRVNVLRENISIQGRVWTGGFWNEATGRWEENPPPRLSRHTFSTVGILEFRDSGFGWDPNESAIFVDYRMLEQIQLEVERANRVRARDSRVGIYDNIRIKAEDMRASEDIMRRLREDEGIMLEESLADIRDGIQETQRATQMLLGGIGAISLLVAAIGIANTMFMSIYERTKEIGVMKVLGCPLPGIKSMFLFEASIIGFMGGILGTGLSIAASVLMNEVDWIRSAISNMGGTADDWRFRMAQVEQGAISVVPIWLILAAIAFSTLVGLVSGYLPARRATKISALEAIRNE